MCCISRFLRKCFFLKSSLNLPTDFISSSGSSQVHLEKFVLISADANTRTSSRRLQSNTCRGKDCKDRSTISIQSSHNSHSNLFEFHYTPNVASTSNTSIYQRHNAVLDNGTVPVPVLAVLQCARMPIPQVSMHCSNRYAINWLTLCTALADVIPNTGVQYM